MSDREDFDKLVDAAMADPSLSAMRPVVEKELLHCEIFQALDAQGLLRDLVLQGGAALRLCRGSDRFSEDLDFAGGRGFSSGKVARIKECVEQRIGERFGLKVAGSHKAAKIGSEVKVDKWWVSIETSPGNPAMPRQRIKLVIANVPARASELAPLRASYDSARAMARVLVRTETIGEIMADKVLAFPTSLRDNLGRCSGLDSGKIRHRDIWDLAWLAGQGAKLDPKLVAAKIGDYGVRGYEGLLDDAVERVPEVVASSQFTARMSRFVDSATVAKTLGRDGYLDYLASSAGGIFSAMRSELPNALAGLSAGEPATAGAAASKAPKLN